MPSTHVKVTATVSRAILRAYRLALIVIADTSPRNDLIRIEQATLLSTLCGQVIIPPAVWHALHATDAGPRHNPPRYPPETRRSGRLSGSEWSRGWSDYAPSRTGSASPGGGTQETRRLSATEALGVARQFVPWQRCFVCLHLEYGEAMGGRGHLVLGPGASGRCARLSAALLYPLCPGRRPGRSARP